MVDGYDIAYSELELLSVLLDSSSLVVRMKVALNFNVACKTA